ncbi:hypothetical protein HPB47_016030, partial [Ixodes persulcatus]
YFVTEAVVKLAGFTTPAQWESVMPLPERRVRKEDVESKLEPFEKMWTVMSSSPGEVLTASNAEGVERVLRGNYAFFMESSTIEYLVDRDSILQLQDSGVLQKLKKRWWTGHCSSQESSKVDSSEEVNALSVSNVGGIFLVLLGGLGVSSVIAILEFVWKTRPSNAKHSSPGSCALKEMQEVADP